MKNLFLAVLTLTLPTLSSAEAVPSGKPSVPVRQARAYGKILRNGYFEAGQFRKGGEVCSFDQQVPVFEVAKEGETSQAMPTLAMCDADANGIPVSVDVAIHIGHNAASDGKGGLKKVFVALNAMRKDGKGWYSDQSQLIRVDRTARDIYLGLDSPNFGPELKNTFESFRAEITVEDYAQ